MLGAVAELLFAVDYSVFKVRAEPRAGVEPASPDYETGTLPLS